LTCQHLYPTLLPGNVGAKPESVPTLKNMFASIKKLAKFCEITFQFKKSEKEFVKLTFGNSEFIEYEI